MSKTYIGIIVILAGWIGIGDIITQDSAAVIVNNVLEIIGMITAIYGRYKAGGINFLGFRK